jgi:hypothetical protein
MRADRGLWGRRPLTSELVEYAAADVVYLTAVVAAMSDRAGAAAARLRRMSRGLLGEAFGSGSSSPSGAPLARTAGGAADSSSGGAGSSGDGSMRRVFASSRQRQEGPGAAAAAAPLHVLERAGELGGWGLRGLAGREAQELLGRLEHLEQRGPAGSLQGQGLWQQAAAALGATVLPGWQQRGDWQREGPQLPECLGECQEWRCAASLLWPEQQAGGAAGCGSSAAAERLDLEGAEELWWQPGEGLGQLLWRRAGGAWQPLCSSPSSSPSSPSSSSSSSSSRPSSGSPSSSRGGGGAPWRASAHLDLLVRAPCHAVLHQGPAGSSSGSSGGGRAWEPADVVVLAAQSYRHAAAAGQPGGGALLRMLPVQRWRAGLLADWLHAAVQRPRGAQLATALKAFSGPTSPAPPQSRRTPLLVVLGSSADDTLPLLHSLALHCSSSLGQRVAMVHSRHDAHAFGLPTGGGGFQCYVDPEEEGRRQLLQELASGDLADVVIVRLVPSPCGGRGVGRPLKTCLPSWQGTAYCRTVVALTYSHIQFTRI